MAEPPKKRLKPDVNYSTPSYSQRRSTEMDMFSPNGGFGPVGFRTPFSIPNTPISIAGDTPTLGNLPIRDPVAPLRGFFEIVEKADRKICNGTTISKCRSGTIAATSDDCGTCRMDIKDLKKTICKNWNDFKSEPLIQRTATSLNSSHVQGFLYQAKQEWIKRKDMRQTAMNSGRGGIDQDATQPTASQVLRDWTVPNRTFHSNE
jgi:hypothetical protein